LRGFFYFSGLIQFIVYTISRLYFVSLASLSVLPFLPLGDIPIDSKGYHWLLWGILNSAFIFSIYFFSKNKKFHFPTSPVLNSYLIFFIVSSLSTTVALNKTESLVRLTDLFVILSSYAIVYFTIQNKLIKINFLLWLIFIKLFIEIIMVYYQLYYYTLGFQIDFNGNYSQYLKSFYGNKNVTSFALLIQSTISMILFTRLKSKGLRTFVLITILLSFFILFYISTRAIFLTILISLILTILLFLYKYLYSNTKSFDEFKKMSLYFIIIFSSYLLFNLTNNDQNIEVNDRLTSISQDSGDESITNRIRFWNQAGNSILKKPILGIGVGNWKIYSIKYDSENIYSYVIPYSTHNDFLEIFAETGIFGFLFYLGFFLLLIKQSILNLFKWIRSKLNHYHIYLFLCLVYFIIDINLNFPLSRPLMQIVLVLFIVTFETLNYSEK